MNSKTNNWILYGIGSVLFLLIPIVSSPDFSLDFHFLTVKPFLRSMIVYLLLLVYFYALLFYFIPHLYRKQQYWYFGLCLLGSFLICGFVPFYFLPHNHPEAFQHMQGGHQHPPDFRFFFVLTQYMFQFLGLSFFAYTLYVDRQLKHAEKAKVEAELAYLKAQINPHFLFNTLNAIYGLAIDKSDKTPDAVVQLSNMMRYLLSQVVVTFVPLEQELAYISDYVSLQAIRLSKDVVMDFKIEGTPTDQVVAPMILIPFIENAFKYGVNPDANCDIKIHIRVLDQRLELYCFNRKVNMKRAYSESSKVGISNVQQRLEVLYANKYQLNIQNEEDSFSVHLTIQMI